MFQLIVGDGIEIKLLQLKHAEPLFAAMDKNRAHLREWLPWVDHAMSSEDTMSFISGELSRFTSRSGWTNGVWVNGRCAGTISFNTIDRNHNKTDIGYWLAKEYTGQGIMTRACREMIHYAFNEMKMYRVEIRAATENVRSRAIPERLGFRQEGIVRGVERVGRRYLDHAIYGLLRNEWVTST